MERNHLVVVASYKGTGKLFNKIVRTLDRTQYSHTELGLNYLGGDSWECWSSSFMDGGVRCKEISLTDDHWTITELPITEGEYQFAKEFAEKNKGVGYDVWGMLGAGFMIPREHPELWFCNEFVGGALQFIDPWRYRPSNFYEMVQRVAYERRDWLAPSTSLVMEWSRKPRGIA